MYVGKQVTADEVNFLASSKFTSFSTMVDDTNAAVTTDDLGHKVIPAGTILPTNDAKAKGILLDEVNVTNGAQLAPLMVEGWVLGQRLPVAPTAEAITAMTTIHFKDADKLAKPAPATTDSGTPAASTTGSTTSGSGSTTGSSK